MTSPRRSFTLLELLVASAAAAVLFTVLSSSLLAQRRLAVRTDAAAASYAALSAAHAAALAETWHVDGVPAPAARTQMQTRALRFAGKGDAGMLREVTTTVEGAVGARTDVREEKG